MSAYPQPEFNGKPRQRSNVKYALMKRIREYGVFNNYCTVR